MAFTQTQVDALKAAIASGTKTVAYGDKSITYHDLSSMLEALGIMEAELAAGSGTESTGRSTLASFSRG